MVLQFFQNIHVDFVRQEIDICEGSDLELFPLILIRIDLRFKLRHNLRKPRFELIEISWIQASHRRVILRANSSGSPATFDQSDLAKKVSNIQFSRKMNFLILVHHINVTFSLRNEIKLFRMLALDYNLVFRHFQQQFKVLDHEVLQILLVVKHCVFLNGCSENVLRHFILKRRWNRADKFVHFLLVIQSAFGLENELLDLLLGRFRKPHVFHSCVRRIDLVLKHCLFVVHLRNENREVSENVSIHNSSDQNRIGCEKELNRISRANITATKNHNWMVLAIPVFLPNRDLPQICFDKHVI